MSTKRVLRINELLKEEIGKIILRDIGFDNALVTITRVDTASNIITSKIFISVIPDKKLGEIIRYLERNVYEIQQKLNKRLRIRPVPKIIFKPEKLTKSAQVIEEILNKIKDKD